MQDGGLGGQRKMAYLKDQCMIKYIYTYIHMSCNVHYRAPLLDLVIRHLFMDGYCLSLLQQLKQGIIVTFTNLGHHTQSYISVTKNNCQVLWFVFHIVPTLLKLSPIFLPTSSLSQYNYDLKFWQLRTEGGADCAVTTSYLKRDQFRYVW